MKKVLLVLLSVMWLGAFAQDSLKGGMTISKDSLSNLVNQSNDIMKLSINPATKEEAFKRQTALVENYKGHQFTLEDFDNLQGTRARAYNYSKTLRLVFYPSLERISKERSVNGARAAYLKMSYYPYDESPDKRVDNDITRAKLFEECTLHPAFAELVSVNNMFVNGLFSSLLMLSTNTIKKTHLLDGIYSALAISRSFDVSIHAVNIFKNISSSHLGLSKDSVEAFRNLINFKTKEAIDSVETYPGKYDKDGTIINKLKKSYEYLNSSIAKGELLNSPAPELEFIWCSNPDIRKLSDTKGNVTIIDFWATWCVPCVRSFSNIRELQERYKEYKVTIIGLTSIQGSHTDRKNNKKIDTKGDTDKEISLMPSFIKDMNVTWNIAFSKNDVFNSFYGVVGIPHVVIIDTKGDIRFNGINPNSDPAHEAEKIDALLQEAGLPFPVNPMSKKQQ